MSETRYTCRVEGREASLVVRESGGSLVLANGERVHQVEIHPQRRCIRTATVDGRRVEFGVVKKNSAYHIVIAGVEYRVEVADARFAALLALGRPAAAAGGTLQVRAPIPGLVVRVLVAPGQEVARDQPLVVLDAMKLENEILSPRAGVVGRVRVAAGQAVEKEEVLLEVGERPAGAAVAAQAPCLRSRGGTSGGGEAPLPPTQGADGA